MPRFAIIMLAAVFLGFVIAEVLTLTAGRISAKEKLSCSGVIFINVLFAVFAAWSISVRSSVVDVSITMKIPCLVLGLMTFICCVIQAAVIKIETENGRTEKLAVKILIPEILSVIGLIYFLIQSRIPL